MGFFVGLLVWMLFVMWNRQKDLVTASFYSGYRKAVKDAVEVADSHGDESLYGAPEGELTKGVLKANVAHEISSDLRDLTRQIGRQL